jgi:hypothetical protein
VDEELLLALRVERQRRSGGGVDWDALLFEEQRRAFHDTSRWLALPGGRQGGKTDLEEKLLLAAAHGGEGTQSFYVSTSIKRAKATVWDELVELNRSLGLGGKPYHVGTPYIWFPRSRTKLTVTGVENKRMADDLRGRKKVALYLLDECQDWPDDLLRYFYEKVVFPSLTAVAGRVGFAGTGGAPRGFWYEVATRDPTFSRHYFTPLTNPFLSQGEARLLIDKACHDRGVDETDASIQREFYARFVSDMTRQIFPWNAQRNSYQRGELPGGNWQHVIAADVGTVDATSVGCLGWSDEDPRLWLVDRVSKTGLGPSGQLRLFRGMAAKYNATLMGAVADPGGGGAGLIVDLSSGPDGLEAEAAEKQGKVSACILMRDALRTGMLMIPSDDTEMIEDLQRPEWDPDNVGKAIRGHMPDNVDMLLYGFRKARALNWYSAPPPPKPQPTKAEEWERRWDEHDERSANRAETDDWAERDWG